MSTTKDEVLARLIRGNGYISGEEIRSELGISRTAVNAAVKSLRADGCEIESVTNKGYRLTKVSDKLSAGHIMAELSKDRCGDITVLDRINSTNTYLRTLSQEGKAEFGDCIIANEQTAGRGRLGRSFESAAGKGIYMSYLVDPKGCSPKVLSQLTSRAAVAVRNAISKVCGISTGIKWVNDLVYGTKKLCGILTEMSVVGESGEASNVILGIGINVSHAPGDFPPDISQIATSLRQIVGEDVDRARLCAVIIEELDSLVAEFPENKEYYLSEYRKNCAVLGKKSRIIRNDTQRIGTALGIDDEFGLIIEFDDGKTETVTGGEVSVRGFYGYI